MASNWISYNELAWTEDLLAEPEAYEKEVNGYVNLINMAAKEPVQTLLHLGCGAGWHDRFFKKHFRITGVDISTGMINKAKDSNPEIEYFEDDMRTVRLNRKFDCVVIPDSIDYMATLPDLQKAIQTASIHLKHGGVFLIVGNTEDKFQSNNFAYTGEKGDIHVTVLENNYVNPYSPNTYEITMVYLIRHKGKLTKYVEESVAGLFSHSTWMEVLRRNGFVMDTRILNGLYDSYLLGGGAYPLTIFFGTKE
ncbi:MAG TPA: class I SAM-dependent methyltransferase [Bacteroidales bacterium]|nr:class I SAM-dependent methyltransferase [Bacteroidales bacterium]